MHIRTSRATQDRLQILDQTADVCLNLPDSAKAEISITSPGAPKDNSFWRSTLEKTRDSVIRFYPPFVALSNPKIMNALSVFIPPLGKAMELGRPLIESFQEAIMKMQNHD